MAIVDSILKIKSGKLGDLRFYKDADGRTIISQVGDGKPRISLEHTDANQFISYNLEFGRASTVASQIRRALPTRQKYMRDPGYFSRLSGLLTHIVHTDFLGERFERKFQRGNLNLLTGFEFNRNRHFKEAFHGKFSSEVDRQTGKMKVEFQPFTPALDVSGPANAKQFQLIVQGASLSKSPSRAEDYSEVFDLQSDATQAPFSLELQVKPGQDEIMLLSVGIIFLEEEYGEVYVVRDGALVILDACVPAMENEETEPAVKLTLTQYLEHLDHHLQKKSNQRCGPLLKTVGTTSGKVDTISPEQKAQRRRWDATLAALRKGVR